MRFNALLMAAAQASGGTAGVASTTVGPNSPGTFADLGDGSYSWSNTSNVASSNNTYATATLDPAVNSNTIRARNFGFSIPLGATVTNIKVEVEAKASLGGEIGFAKTQIAIHAAGTAADRIGISKFPTPSTLTTTDTYSVADATQASWGTALTPSDVNAATFSVDVVMSHLNNDSFDPLDVFIDHIRITITYTGP
jgi:hypothetical protein